MNVLADTAVHATLTAPASKFYPYKDGYKDTLKIGGVLSERTTVTVRIYSSGGTLKRTYSLGTLNPGAWSTSWNGRTAAGTAVAAATYTIKVTFKDVKLHTKTSSATSTVSWRKVSWKSVTVTKYAQAGTYYVGVNGGAIYYSPDYPKGRILDSGEMIRDCTNCGFAAGQFWFQLVNSTTVLAYRKLYLETRGHGFTDREHTGNAAIVNPATDELALQRPLPEYDVVGTTSGIPFTSSYLDATKRLEAWIWMEQSWGDAWDANYLMLTYQYAVWA